MLCPGHSAMETLVRCPPFGYGLQNLPTGCRNNLFSHLPLKLPKITSIPLRLTPFPRARWWTRPAAHARDPRRPSAAASRRPRRVSSGASSSAARTAGRRTSRRTCRGPAPRSRRTSGRRWPRTSQPPWCRARTVIRWREPAQSRARGFQSRAHMGARVRAHRLRQKNPG